MNQPMDVAEAVRLLREALHLRTDRPSSAPSPPDPSAAWPASASSTAFGSTLSWPTPDVREDRRSRGRAGDRRRSSGVANDATEAVGGLVWEREIIAKLHEVIPKTGGEPRSEALEHFVEHLMSRKQEQVDQLLRALKEPE